MAMGGKSFQHTSEELIEVAKILDALNKFSGNNPDLRLEGELKISYDNVCIGRIVSSRGVWVYSPDAENPSN
jgi:hypothetical protein